MLSIWEATFRFRNNFLDFINVVPSYFPHRCSPRIYAEALLFWGDHVCEGGLVPCFWEDALRLYFLFALSLNLRTQEMHELLSRRCTIPIHFCTHAWKSGCIKLRKTFSAFVLQPMLFNLQFLCKWGVIKVYLYIQVMLLRFIFLESIIIV